MRKTNCSKVDAERVKERDRGREKKRVVLTAKWSRPEVTSQRSPGRKVSRDLKFTEGSVVKAALGRPRSVPGARESSPGQASLPHSTYTHGRGVSRASRGTRTLKYFPLNASGGGGWGGYAYIQQRAEDRAVTSSTLIYRGRFPSLRYSFSPRNASFPPFLFSFSSRARER